MPRRSVAEQWRSQNRLVEGEIVQHSPSALTVIMGLERIGINLPPFGAEK